uniref:uncharacterized protein LOC113475836 n=1 Tax=Ciona intestinalis TaxID=7719 RepID=UPI000EF4E2D5|nr:uncharacterized protein LOC113475836 [Ciona intestinalis]|eukprot:XP_026696710.1 uncharacterized protein LOC113475836 [Ciona intestinalis]
MTSNNDAWIDAVKTSDGTGWEWSTTHDKFYFKTTVRGIGPNVKNGKYNNWHRYQPDMGNYATVASDLGEHHLFSWKSVIASTMAHYICQITGEIYYLKIKNTPNFILKMICC